MDTPPIARVPPDQSSSPAPSVQTDVRIQSTILTYPIDLTKEQDAIRFVILENNKNISGITETINRPLEQKNEYSFVADAPIVFLPIQPSISDQNTVDWGASQLNELQRRLADESLKAMGSGKIGELAENVIKTVMEQAKSFKTLGQLYLAEQALGVQGLLSRYTGNVLNPNLELLFQGPQLRSFNFTFKLSPRSKSEATNVKEIIRFFKKYMSVRKVSGNIFLKSPYVFRISYVKSDNIHPSINRIKECVLQSCSVDYTPLGSYMTYDDDEHTMVSYNMTLQFQEIEPIYDEDYNEDEFYNNKIHPIGF